MSFVFTDRESAYPNRYLVTPDNGSPYYVVLTRADEPVVVGTPLNAETFNEILKYVLPDVSESDNGKVLRVVNGAWAIASAPSGSGGSSVVITQVELPAANWVGADNLYSQVVQIDGVTENSQVNLTPSVEQLVVFYEKDITFATENEGGVVTVYVIGQKPQNDYTIQANIVEVIV